MRKNPKQEVIEYLAKKHSNGNGRYRHGGGQAMLARGCKVSDEAVRQWRSIPIRHIKTIVKLCDGKFTREYLRPDIYT